MKLIRYEGENVTPSDDAILYRKFLSDGLFEAVTPTFTSGAITIPAMRGVICGRDFTTDIETLTAVLASSGTITGQIYMWIDMEDETYPLSIKIRNSGGSLSDDDINNGGQYYGLEIAQYTANTSAVTGVTLTVGLVQQELDVHKADIVTDADGVHGLKVESGTWTPSIVLGTAGTINYTMREGNYVRVGKIIMCNFYIQATITGGSGVVEISGVPFSPINYREKGVAQGSISGSQLSIAQLGNGGVVDRFRLITVTGANLEASAINSGDVFGVAGSVSYQIADWV